MTEKIQQKPNERMGRTDNFARQKCEGKKLRQKHFGGGKNRGKDRRNDRGETRTAANNAFAKSAAAKNGANGRATNDRRANDRATNDRVTGGGALNAGPVNVGPENENALLGLISIARKAGFCIVGQDNLKVYTKKLYLVLLDGRAGDALKKSMNFLAKQSGAQVIGVNNLSKICNIENCRVLGIRNKALAEKIAEKLC